MLSETDPCREAFEATLDACWLVRDGDGYAHDSVESDWRKWQAAWKARGEYEDSVRAKMKEWMTHTTEVPNAD